MPRRHKAVHTLNLSGTKMVDRKEMPPLWLRELCETMQKEPNFVLGLPYMIEISGKSQAHLTRSMQKYFGQTPTQFINNLRLDFALGKLREMDKDDTVLPLIYASGFRSVGHFYKLFKARFGASPKAFQK